MNKVYNLKTGQIEELAGDEVNKIIPQGSHTFLKDETYNLLNPDGKLVGMKGIDVFAAISDGYRFAPEELNQELNQQEKYGTPEYQAKALGLGVLKGAALGTTSPTDALLVRLGADPEALKKIRKYNPTSTLVGEFSSMIGTTLLSGGLGAGAAATKGAAEVAAGKGLVRKIIEGGAKISPTGLVSKGSLKVEQGLRQLLMKNEGTQSLIAKAIVSGTAGAVGSAIEGAAWETGKLLDESALGDTQFTAENVINYAKDGAILGGVLGFGVPAAFTTIKGGAEKFISTFPNITPQLGKLFTGTSVDNIKMLMKDPSALDNVASLDDLTLEMSKKIELLGEAVDNGNITKQEAKEALATAKANFEISQAARKTEYKLNKIKVNETFDKADKALKDKINQFDYFTKNNPVDENVVSTILTDLDDLKSQIVDLSRQSYRLLDNSADIPIITKDRVLSLIDAEIEKLYVTGTKSILSQEKKKAYTLLSELRDTVAQIETKHLSPRQVKEINVDIDLDTNKSYGKDSGSFSEVYASSLKRIRRNLDLEIKDQIIGYEDIMLETSRRASALTDATKLFGNADKIRPKLAKGWMDKMKPTFDVLNQVGGFTGNDYVKIINDASISQRLANSMKKVGAEGKDEAISTLFPAEQQEFIRAAKDVERLKRFDGLSEKEAVDLFNKNAPWIEQLELKKAQGTLDEAVAKYNQLVEDFKGFKSLRNVDTLRRNIKSELSSSDTKHIKSFFKELSKIPDEAGAYQDFTAAITKARLKHAFSVTFLRGSRNETLWKSLLYGVSGIAGAATFGPLGIAAGAAFGAIIDSFGPEILMKVIRGVANIRGNLSPAKVNNVFHKAIPTLTDEKFIGSYRDNLINIMAKAERNNIKTINKYTNSIGLFVKNSARGIVLKSAITLNKKSYDELEKEVELIKESKDIYENNFDDTNDVYYPMLPQTMSSIRETAIKASDFIVSKFPQRPLNDPFNMWMPTQSQMDEFKRYYAYIYNPVLIADNIEGGYIPSEAIEVLKQVYPANYEVLSEIMLDKLTENPELYKSMSNSKRYQISKAFGIDPMDNFSHFSTMMLQNNAEKQIETEQGQNAGQGTGGMKQTGLLKLSGGERAKTRSNRIQSV